MKKTSNPESFGYVFCAVSASLLLASPLETRALELADDDSFPSLQQEAMPRWSLDPVSAHGLNLSTLGAFSDRMAERHGQGAPDLIASQWSQFFPGAPEPGAPVPGQLEAPGQQLQVSPDLFVRETSAGNVHRAGIFVGHNTLQSGYNGLRPRLGERQKSAVNLSGESLGMYWSMTHEQGWHVDAVAMGTRFDVNGRGESGQRLDDSGHALTFSVEGGFPIGLGAHWVIEPQAQLINQQYYSGRQTQGETLEAFSEQPSWTGRVGAKLSARYNVRGMPLEPYVRTNVWYDFSNADTVKLDEVDKISSGRNSATVELGLGLVARLTPKVAMFVSADYSSDVDDNDLNGLIGSLGVRMRW